VKKKIAALVITTGLLLTGCSQANQAASIGDNEISQTQLQSSIDSILAERAKVDTTSMDLQTGQALTRGQLRFMILIQMYDEIAKELQLDVTSALVAEQRSNIIQSIGSEENLPTSLVSAGIAPNDFDLYLRAIAISNLITAALIDSGTPEAEVGNRVSELLTAKSKELKITINPRYGVWDSTIGDIVEADVPGKAVTPEIE
jgi:hypothetical protein